MSGFLSSMAISEQISAASSAFRTSDAGSIFGLAALFGLASIAGFILMLVGGQRMVSRIDQRYDAWFSQIRPMAPGGPQGQPARYPMPQPMAQATHPQPAHQDLPTEAPQYRPGYQPSQQPPRSGPQS